MRAHMRRFVPAGMTRGAISGFVLMIVSAVGTWAVYGRPLNPPAMHPTTTCHLNNKEMYPMQPAHQC